MSRNLFSSVPDDYLGFDQGDSFDVRKVQAMLGLKAMDVAHLAEVAPSAVRWDECMPERMCERLGEIAQTIHRVAQAFDGDVLKTESWFRLRNPMLGDLAPRDMIRLGRHDRLRRFIIQAMRECSAQPWHEERSS